MASAFSEEVYVLWQMQFGCSNCTSCLENLTSPVLDSSIRLLRKFVFSTFSTSRGSRGTYSPAGKAIARKFLFRLYSRISWSLHLAVGTLQLHLDKIIFLWQCRLGVPILSERLRVSTCSSSFENSSEVPHFRKMFHQSNKGCFIGWFRKIYTLFPLITCRNVYVFLDLGAVFVYFLILFLVSYFHRHLVDWIFFGGGGGYTFLL